MALVAQAPAVRRCARANAVVHIRRAPALQECARQRLAQELVQALELHHRPLAAPWAALRAQDSVTSPVV